MHAKNLIDALKYFNKVKRYRRLEGMAMKGQGAAEYLILLAMVLIVSLIGIVLLGGFTENGASAMDSESASYWNGVARPFAINSWVQAEDTLYMEVENRGINRFIITNVSISGGMHDLGAGGWVFGPGSKKNISFSGLTRCNKTSYDYYSYNIVFYYDSEDINGKTQAGAKPLAGSCAFP